MHSENPNGGKLVAIDFFQFLCSSTTTTNYAIVGAESEIIVAIME